MKKLLTFLPILLLSGCVSSNDITSQLGDKYDTSFDVLSKGKSTWWGSSYQSELQSEDGLVVDAIIDDSGTVVSDNYASVLYAEQLKSELSSALNGVSNNSFIYTSTYSFNDGEYTKGTMIKDVTKDVYVYAYIYLSEDVNIDKLYSVLNSKLNEYNTSSGKTDIGFFIYKCNSSQLNGVKDFLTKYHKPDSSLEAIAGDKMCILHTSSSGNIKESLSDLKEKLE